jgi:hypothetical protein
MKFSKLLSASILLLFGASLVSALAQDNPAQASARAALEKMFQSPTNSPVNAATTSKTAAVAAPVSAKPAGKKAGAQPMTGPPLPISAAKQAQLEVLLDLYKADRITPADYQKQRAVILAAPN